MKVSSHDWLMIVSDMKGQFQEAELTWTGPSPEGQLTAAAGTGHNPSNYLCLLIVVDLIFL